MFVQVCPNGFVHWSPALRRCEDNPGTLLIGAYGRRNLSANPSRNLSANPSSALSEIRSNVAIVTSANEKEHDVVLDYVLVTEDAIPTISYMIAKVRSS